MSTKVKYKPYFNPYSTKRKPEKKTLQDHIDDLDQRLNTLNIEIRELLPTASKNAKDICTPYFADQIYSTKKFSLSSYKEG